jgi:hypothetical protein
VLGLVQPAAILWLMGGGEFDFADQVESAWQVLREAIRAPRLSRRPVVPGGRRTRLSVTP